MKTLLLLILLAVCTRVNGQAPVQNTDQPTTVNLHTAQEYHDAGMKILGAGFIVSAITAVYFSNTKSHRLAYMNYALGTSMILTGAVVVHIGNAKR